jgi:hypothetical protein
MVYNTQSQWVSGLCPSSGIPDNQKTRRLENRNASILSRGEGHNLFGPPERANLNLISL